MSRRSRFYARVCNPESSRRFLYIAPQRQPPTRDGEMPTPHAPRSRDSQHFQWGLLAGFLLLAGCSHWRTEHVSPVTLLTATTPRRVRITRIDESRVVLHNPRLVGDTIVDDRSGHARDRRVPLTDVAQVAVRKLDPLATGGLVVGTAALGAVVAIGVMWDARAD